jgi:hypothetical protein
MTQAAIACVLVLAIKATGNRATIQGAFTTPARTAKTTRILVAFQPSLEGCQASREPIPVRKALSPYGVDKSRSIFEFELQERGFL